MLIVYEDIKYVSAICNCTIHSIFKTNRKITMKTYQNESFCNIYVEDITTPW